MWLSREQRSLQVRWMQIATITVDGLAVRVGRTSVASPAISLLLFNGIGASLELVKPLTEAMRREGFPSIVFDVPGVGGSETPALPYRLSRLARLADKLLGELGLDGPVDVLGVSWGGALAQEFVHQYPARCRRLVLAATSAGAVMVPGRISALSKMISPRRYTDPKFMEQMGAELYGGQYRNDAALLHEHARHMAPPTGKGYVWQLLATVGWTSILWLHRIRQPTLVMMGNDDPIVPVVNGRLLTGLIPNSRLYTIDDGHLFLLSRCAEVVPVIRDFLRESDADLEGARTCAGRSGQPA
jgi:poly(3-hydroxyalkanoate) depolymerase